MPLVSILIPVYNAADYLEKCVHSVVSQTEKDWELVLVDDGSLDSSGIIADHLAAKDSRIKVIHKVNGGVSSARNAGLDAATGEYIVFIDSDDIVEPKYLEELLRWKVQGRSIVYGNVVNDYTDLQASRISFDYEDGKIIDLSNDHKGICNYRLIENGFPIAKLFRRKIIQDAHLRFDESISFHEDHVFVLSYLSLVDRVFLSAPPCYHYIHRRGVASLSRKRHSPRQLIASSRLLIDRLEQGNRRWQIPSGPELQRLYTYLGLNQLMLALQNSSPEDVQEVCREIRGRYELFREFYRPNHPWLRLIPHFLNLHPDRFLRALLNLRGKTNIH